MFAHYAADHSVLWNFDTAHDAAAHAVAREYYLDLMQQDGAERTIAMAATVLTTIALIALSVKLARRETSAMLFDGASLLLYGAVITIYVTSVRNDFLALASTPTPTGSAMEEILRDLASAHTVIAVALTGVITMQSVQSWVDRSDARVEAGVLSSGALPPSSAPASAQKALEAQLEETDADTEAETPPAVEGSGTVKARRRRKTSNRPA